MKRVSDCCDLIGLLDSSIFRTAVRMAHHHSQQILRGARGQSDGEEGMDGSHPEVYHFYGDGGQRPSGSEGFGARLDIGRFGAFLHVVYENKVHIPHEKGELANQISV